jgi:cellulose synthase/poly-beta-1,6-N-acetylglucosamine synthase-like glycosyltransferase
MAFRTLPISAILRSLLHLWGKLMEESSDKPRVSIIIPTNNSGETIEECLRSIQGQNYPLYEVIIVDNFSNFKNSSVRGVSLLTLYVNGLFLEVLGGLGVLWCV